MRIKYDVAVKLLTDCQSRLLSHRSEHMYFYNQEYHRGSYDDEGYIENAPYQIIDEIGKEVVEICNSVFPGPNENNYPFGKLNRLRIESSKTTQEQAEMISQKMYRLTLFIEHKLKKLELYSDDDDNVPKENSTPDLKTQTTIGTVGTYVAGDSINISNVTNYLKELQKEIEKEPRLNDDEKAEIQKIIEEESVRWSEVKSNLVKYGAKFTGQALRSFMGFD